LPEVAVVATGVTLPHREHSRARRLHLHHDGAAGHARRPERDPDALLRHDAFCGARRIIEILREHEAGATVAEVCRKHGMSSATFYAWKAKYGGMDVSEAKRLKALEAENAKLKRLYADAMLDNAGLKELLAKKW
jgi:putative transposase